MLHTIYMKKKITLIVIIVLTVVFTAFNVSCKNNSSKSDLPDSQIETVSDVNKDENQKNTEPVIAVYNTSMKKIVDMKLEEYVKGVVAGEMYNNWNMEALKAQAVLARTYTYYFLNNCNSKYKGADISTDILEAQAYNEANINQSIENAVNETRGKVIMCGDEYIKAWFHSNSGGKTTLASVGLNYIGDQPEYIKSVSSPENSQNSENFNWSYNFTKTEILNALRKMGVSVSNVSTFKIGSKSSDGRSETLVIGGKEVNASTFRLNIGSTKMKSTWITSISLNGNSVTVKGRGYGHGVGMSQWGAKIMAENGKTFDTILSHYFKNVELKTLYS